MDLKVSEIAAVTGGALKQGLASSIVRGVSTDSRMIDSGNVFFALKGSNFDGHRFIKEVSAKGASAAVVESAEGLEGLPDSFGLIVVGDTLKALGALASYIRCLHKIPFVAVSGSAGKTTTKEMIAFILGRSRNVLKTEGNKNNLIGLPLTLFNLTSAHEAAVVELGISETWEMERLVNICRPDIAVITNIGSAHLETLGSLEGVAKAKGALFTLLDKHAVRIVNMDDPWVVRLAEPFEKVTYSMKEKADVTVKDHSVEEGFTGVTATYDVRGKELTIRFNVPGMANVINGAAAIAACLALGVSLNDMKEGLEEYTPVHGRMEVVRTNGVTILDDTYNANPQSMAAALRTLSKAKGRKIAVMGDMLELGEASANEHFKIGALAGELGVNAVISIGKQSEKIAEGAISTGVKEAHAFKDKAAALSALKEILKENDSVLVKASRGMALEAIVEGLKGTEAKKACC